MKFETLDAHLRASTQEVHKETEKAIEPLNILGPYKPEHYSAFLLLQYHWLNTMEESIKTCATTEPEFSVQPDLLLIEKDLRAMNAFREAELLEPLENASLPGLIYTIEGSKAGASMINRHLQKEGVAPEIRNYLSSCEANIRTTMPALRTYLRAIPDENSTFDEAVATSKASFDLMVRYVEALR